MEKNIYPGKFVVFEGLDGSGQSTETDVLTAYLKQKDIDVLATKEPTKESEAGKRIRKILDEKENIAPLELQKLFAEDRAWHLQNVITPALKQGKTVISDRYFFSSFAFGASDGIEKKELYKMNREFLMPDIVFFLDAGPKICLGRIEVRGGKKKLFEKKEKLEKVYENYKLIFKDFKDKTKIHFIDAKGSIKQVFEQIIANLN